MEKANAGATCPEPDVVKGRMASDLFQVKHRASFSFQLWGRHQTETAHLNTITVFTNENSVFLISGMLGLCIIYSIRCVTPLAHYMTQ